MLPGFRDAKPDLRARIIQFFDGHVSSYRLSGSRGRDAASAGTAQVGQGPADSGMWTGILEGEVSFPVEALPSTPQQCAAVAYSFDLVATGTATDSYRPPPKSSSTRTLLVVSPT